MPTASRIAVAQALLAVFGDARRVPDDWDTGLEAQDAAFAQAVLGLCLRRWGRLGHWVESHLSDPSRGVPLGTRIALAIGLAQLAWLEGVGTHAAVFEAVELATTRDLGFPPHKGLVNALLRRAAQDREGLRRSLDQLPPGLDRPPFADQVLRAALGPGGGATEALWSRLQRPPRPAFRILRGEAPPELEPDEELQGCWRLREGSGFPGSWLASGAGMVQDRSSQALMAFRWDPPPARILDACAAPGGKTASLGLRFPSAQLTAVERDPRRAQKLARNLEARRIRAEVVRADLLEFLAREPGTFDLILLDAPCSGSGTIQKHPELPWILGAADVARLARLQRGMLEACLPRLGPGGLLLYAVCSWLPEEGAAHREWMAAAHPEMEPAAVWRARPGDADGFSASFRPSPLDWDGEGFQAFGWTR